MTSPDNIRVRFGALQQASQDINSAHAGIEAQLQDVRTAVGQLGVWDGASSDFYRQQQQQIDAAWNDLKELLAQIRGRTDQATQQYMETESGVGAMFRA
jgi:WXG100 family type VII secretion target